MPKYLYTDLYSAFEKFSIMTVDGNMSDEEALKKLKLQCGPNTFNALVKEVRRTKNAIHSD